MFQVKAEILQKVSELQLRTRRSVSTLLSGNYRSTFRGSGMQFKEFRHYEPGDDIRHMAWQVTARTGRATIKTFEEDRELNVLVMVDVSGSSTFGFSKRRKIDMYAELVALIGLAAVRSKDKVALLTFTDTAQSYLPPKDTEKHVLHATTRVLSEPLGGQPSDIRRPLRFAYNVLKNRTLVVILSDFLVPNFATELQLISKRHEVVLLHCFDDAERGSLIDAVYEVCHPETGEYFLLDGKSEAVKKACAEHYVKQRDQLEQIARQSRTDYLSLSIEDDYLQRLVNFFRRRGPATL